MASRNSILVLLAALLFLGAKQDRPRTELTGAWGITLQSARRQIPRVTISFSADGQFRSEYLSRYGFDQWNCRVTVGRTSVFSAAGDSSRGERAEWVGTATGDDIEGMLKWTRGETVEEFTFSGSRSTEAEVSTNWPLVLMYFVAGAAGLGAMYKERLAQRRTYEARVPRLWMGLGIVLLFLGLAKGIHLQEWVNDWGRSYLKGEQAYGQRRPLQALLIVQAVIVGLLALAGAVWYGRSIRKIWRRYLLAIGAVIYLLTFVLVRAISLHQVDHWLSDNSLLGMSYNTILELLGQLALAAAAAQAIWRDWDPKLRAYETRVKIR